MSKKNKTQKIDFLSTYQSVRKPAVRATQVINPKKRYDRKDKSWRNDI
jgi:hypothetical protein